MVQTKKKALGISNAKLSELSGVPIGTIDRILSGNYNEFKYSSIQPIIVVLIGYHEDTPLPDNKDDKQKEYYETIEGYKLVIENKNNIISSLQFEIERLQRSVDYLKKIVDQKDEETKSVHKRAENLEKNVSMLMEILNKKS